MNGFIKIHRELLEWEWAQDPNMISLLIHLILLASFTDKKWKGIDVRRGELITSYESLSEKTGLSVKQVRTCLNRLVECGEVGKQTTNKYTLIRVLKYEKFQTSEMEGQSNDNQRAGKGQAEDNQRADKGQHLKNVKKEKNVKNIKKRNIKEKSGEAGEELEVFESFWNLYGKKVGKENAFKSWQKISSEDKRKIFTTLPAYIQSTPEIKFRKHPATYLNGKHWEDELPTQDAHEESEREAMHRKHLEGDALIRELAGWN